MPAGDRARVGHRPAGLTVRVVSWNVNSIRTRVEGVLGWIDRHQPDVVLLQETKCVDAAMPVAELLERGYDVAHHGIDHWNGVAIASRCGLAEVERGFAPPGVAPLDEARVIRATCAGVRVVSLYVPNGRELTDPHYLFKLAWLERLRHDLAAELAAGRSVLAAGDFNVAPADVDIYDPRRWRGKTHASPPERAALAALVGLGLHDVVREHLPGPGVFTWWSYRPGQFEANRGLRIDHVLADPATAARVERVWIDREARAAPRPSDHAPVVVDLGAAR